MTMERRVPFEGPTVQGFKKAIAEQAAVTPAQRAANRAKTAGFVQRARQRGHEVNHDPTGPVISLLASGPVPGVPLTGDEPE